MKCITSSEETCILHKREKIPETMCSGVFQFLMESGAWCQSCGDLLDRRHPVGIDHTGVEDVFCQFLSVFGLLGIGLGRLLGLAEVF